MNEMVTSGKAIVDARRVLREAAANPDRKPPCVLSSRRFVHSSIRRITKRIRPRMMRTRRKSPLRFAAWCLN
jgi:hypothetical protein